MDIRPVAGNTVSAPMADKPAPAVRKEAVGAVVHAAAVEAAKDARAVDSKQLDEAVSNINKVLSVRSQELEFSVDKESDRTIVTVLDKNTKEVIRQMPSREALEIAKALDRLQSLLTRQTA
jgi:flagellar protein FlaG